jgi:TrpR-related protein YerC/YecD
MWETIKTQWNDIVTVLSLMDSRTDISNFLKDLMTVKELQEFTNRFEVAQMLEERKTYIQIEKQTWMSSTTIARVSKFLSGNNFGYKKALQILKSITDKHHTGHRS